MASRLTLMHRLYTGNVVHNWQQLEAYTGRRAAERIVGPLRQRAYLLNYEQLGINYAENVEYQLRREQVILCPQTVDFLYTEFTPAAVTHEPGTRPGLEEVVADAAAGCTTAQQKVLGLMRFCRGLYKRDRVDDYSKYIYGGTEEQLIKKGERLCECLGRLFVALCEIAGIPARIVMHDIGGHITAEARVDGHWGYIDPRCGVYFLKPDGAMASVWELWQDPSLMRGQSEEAKADVGEQWTYEERLLKCERKYFHPEEINGFQNYSLRNASRYSYNQLTQDEATRAGLFVINDFYREAANRIFGLEDDFDLFIPSERKPEVDLADKHYLAGPDTHLPVEFVTPASAEDVCNRLLLMHIADDVPKARAAGYDVEATLVFRSRALTPGEKLEVYVNTEGPIVIDSDLDRESWRRGERKIAVDADWWQLGANTVRFVYSTQSLKEASELLIPRVELLLKYRR